VRDLTVAGEHGLREGMCAGRDGFYLDGDEDEELDLPGAHMAVPHGPLML